MLSRETLAEIIRRVVEVAQPERIILFGSAARRQTGPHSEVDLLVIKSGEFDQSRLVGDIYMNLHGVGQGTCLTRRERGLSCPNGIPPRTRENG